ncbi:pentapeptide repeat-containing protein [Nocardia sp. NPDC050193]
MKLATVATAAGTLMAALAAVGALYFSNSTLSATNEQLGLARRTAQTDQIKAGAEQLDSDKESVRLSGVYLFERLAEDSEVDRPALRRLLEAFIRTETTTGPCDLPEHEAPTDIQAALAVITKYDALPAPTPSVSLEGACLARANLESANLTNTNLRSTNLTHANLRSANLTNARLLGANLTHANLNGANLTNVHLVNVNLTDAYLGGLNLTDADLAGLNLTNAYLGGANLTNADLTGLNPEYLAGANLTGIIYSDSTRWPEGFSPPPSA